MCSVGIATGDEEGGASGGGRNTVLDEESAIQGEPGIWDGWNCKRTACLRSFWPNPNEEQADIVPRRHATFQISAVRKNEACLACGKVSAAKS